MASASFSDSKKHDRRRQSLETVCSSNSSCVLQKRKQAHPLAPRMKNRNTSSEISQRVLSAKRLQFKTLQNQLNDANYHIAQLTKENKVLKNLQKRQDCALSRYEGVNAELPQILESHQQELHVMLTKNRNLRKQVKEFTEQLRLKDEELTALKDQNHHLLNLCKSKNLEEREKLTEKVEELTSRLKQNEDTISMLNRKLMLETKNYKFKLNAEISKHKQTQKELQRVLAQIEQFTQKDAKDPQKTAHLRKIAFASVTTLTKKSSSEKSSPRKSDSGTKINKDEALVNYIKSGSTTNLSDDLESLNSDKVDNTSLRSSNSEEWSSKKHSSSSSQERDSSAEYQLKEIVNSWQKKSKIDDELIEYRDEVVKDVQITNELVAKHNDDYKNSIKDTEIILQSLKETDELNEKLNQLRVSGEQLSYIDYNNLIEITDKNANNILSARKNDDDIKPADLLQNKSVHFEPDVDKNEKQILLAKLRAIDNGDSIEVLEPKKDKKDLMKELFG